MLYFQIEKFIKILKKNWNLLILLFLYQKYKIQKKMNFFFGIKATNKYTLKLISTNNKKKIFNS